CDVTDLALSPEGQRIVTTCEDSTVRVWIPDGEPIAQLTSPAAIERFAVGPNAQTIAIHAKDGMTHLFAVPSGRHITKLPQADVRSLALSTDGRRLILRDDEGHVGVWTAGAGSEAAHLTMNGNARDVRFSPDDSKLAVCSENGASVFAVRGSAPALPFGGSG